MKKLVLWVIGGFMVVSFGSCAFTEGVRDSNTSFTYWQKHPNAWWNEHNKAGK